MFGEAGSDAARQGGAMRILITAMLAMWMAAMARADGVFDLARKPGESVWVTLDERASRAEALAEPPMLRRVHGVLAVLSSSQVSELLASVDASAAGSAALTDAKPVCVIHMDGVAGKRVVVIERGSSGACAARVLDPAEPDVKPGRTMRCGIRADRLDGLLDAAAGYAGGFDEGAEKQARGEAFEVERPYQIGCLTLDARTIADRIGASGYIRFDPAARVLNKETLFARLPAGYNARRAAGLVVWMDPSPSGKPPLPLWKGLDALGMVCIGAANAGNDRGVTERLQLALDAVATARRRWNIDAGRVYVVGVSGGGKMSSILAPCFSDVFAGAVPIVGLSTYQRNETGEIGKAWPPEYSKPKGKRWDSARKARMAAITGTNDFNHAPMLAASTGLARDGMQVRLVDVPGMGHEFPSPEVFATQLAWVDEPARQAREASEKESMAAFEKAADTEAALLEIVRKWPWTEGAWKAVGAMEKRSAGGK